MIGIQCGLRNPKNLLTKLVPAFVKQTYSPQAVTFATSSQSHRSGQSKSSFAGKVLWPSIAGLAFYWLGKPSAKYPKVEGKSLVVQYFSRIRERLTDFFYGLHEPAFEKFLPDKPTNEAHPKKYTLVIDLDNFLVTHIWDTRQGQWKIAKRPGVEMFLFYMAQYYEVVLFSSMNQNEGETILQKLDPYGCITYRLYRFATRFEKGNYYKDISRLNRDLSKVVVFGSDEVGFSGNEENFLKSNRWTGNAADSLEPYIDFFEALAATSSDDIRPIIKRYQSKENVAHAYSLVQNKIYNDMRLHHDQLNQRRSKNLFFWIFARSPDSTSASFPTFEEKKAMLVELRRKEYQNAKKIMDEQLEKERKKHEEFLKQNKVTMWDMAVNGASQMPNQNHSNATN